MGKHVWGYWDCSCGRKHIRGDKTTCPGCGHPRDEHTKFYMNSSKKEYVDDKDINNDPDWICSYCNSQNRANSDTCEQCGAPRIESRKNYFTRENSSNNENNSDNTSSDKSPETQLTRMNPTEKPVSDTMSSIGKVKNWMTANNRRIMKIGIISVSLICVVLSLIWLFTPVERTMQIEGFEWQRTITIEENRKFEESGWSLPAGADLKYTRSEIRSYEQVFDHYETVTHQVQRERITGYKDVVTGYRDLGNGQFEEITSREPIRETYWDTETEQKAVYRDEPVYDTKYYYSIWRWVTTRNVTTSDAGKDPKWGTYTLGDKEREGSRYEHYYLTGRINDSMQKFETSRTKWDSLNTGDNISFTTFRFSNEILEFKDTVIENVSTAA